jgi:nucleoid DNA-binding protein
VEKIYDHIEKLLGHNEYVVIPGLGGFVLQQQPATIVDNKIIAPRKVISFNALMHHADGLLVIEIARTERISYRLAQELLQRETEIFKQQLQTNGSFTFGNFGTFHLTVEGNIAFVPNTQAAFIPSNFGLTDLQLPDYSKKQIHLIPTKQKSLTVKSVMRYAAIFALLLSMLFITEQRPTNPNAQSAAILSLSKLTSAAKIQIQTDSIVVSDTTKQQTQQFLEAEITDNSEAYHVIVASLPTQQSAENYCKRLNELNFPTAKVLEPVKTYRVAIKSFTEKEEAIRFMENLRITDERFSTAWVLCKK